MYMQAAHNKVQYEKKHWVTQSSDKGRVASKEIDIQQVPGAFPGIRILEFGGGKKSYCFLHRLFLHSNA